MIGPCVLDPRPTRSRTGWRLLTVRSFSSPRRRRSRTTQDLFKPRWRRWSMSRCMWSRRCRPGNPTTSRSRPMRRYAELSRTEDAGPRSVCGDPRRYGRDAKGLGPWSSRVRRAVRARSVRGRAASRGSPLWHPPACEDSEPSACEKGAEAMTMTGGATRVAAGFVATGGVARGADLIEQRVLDPTARGRVTN